MLDKRLTRIDSNRLRVQTQRGLPVTVFAKDTVPVESAAVSELLNFLEVEQTVEQFYKAQPESFKEEPILKQVAVTPDFHKARGIPVGTVIATSGFLIPQAIGNDINCGMRLHVTNLTEDQITSQITNIESNSRHIYFGGGRNIPMNREQRGALFHNGLMGLAEIVPKKQTEGLWSLYHELPVYKELERVEQNGSLRAAKTFGLTDFMGEQKLTRDSQIGSIGGGNHFVEIQCVEKIYNRAAAYAFGLKPGSITIMVHSGSLSIGHLCGNYYRDVVRSIYPETLKHPSNNVFVLPSSGSAASLFWDCMSNAANFAFANRFFLALMMLATLRKSFPHAESKLVYDAPHNLIWRDKDTYVHRKGATTARADVNESTAPYPYIGEPVLVPGSMGASSFVMLGKGNPEALCSASHGAGRQLSRGDSSKGHEEEFAEFMRKFKVVTPVDLNSHELRMRPDIIAEKLNDIKQEAPYAYKGIGPIIETLTDADMASPVAELRPLMTIKG